MAAWLACLMMMATVASRAAVQNSLSAPGPIGKLDDPEVQRAAGIGVGAEEFDMSPETLESAAPRDDDSTILGSGDGVQLNVAPDVTHTTTVVEPRAADIAPSQMDGSVLTSPSKGSEIATPQLSINALARFRQEESALPSMPSDFNVEDPEAEKRYMRQAYQDAYESTRRKLCHDQESSLRGFFECVYGVKQRKAERDSARFKQLADVDYNSHMASGAGPFELVRFSGKRDEKKAKNTASGAVFQRLAASIAHAAPGKRAKLIRALWKRRMESLADRYEKLKNEEGRVALDILKVHKLLKR